MNELLGRIEEGDAASVKVLLEAGADPNASDDSGWTALMEAAYGGHAECVRLLLEAGAAPDIQNEEGKTALMLAAEEGHAEAAKLLEAVAIPNSELSS